MPAGADELLDEEASADDLGGCADETGADDLGGCADEAGADDFGGCADDLVEVWKVDGGGDWTALEDEGAAEDGAAELGFTPHLSVEYLWQC